MTDTSKKIKEIQKQVWMSKAPMERLKQFLMDNDDFFAFTKALKAENEKKVQEQALQNIDDNKG